MQVSDVCTIPCMVSLAIHCQQVFSSWAMFCSSLPHASLELAWCVFEIAPAIMSGGRRSCFDEDYSPPPCESEPWLPLSFDAPEPWHEEHPPELDAYDFNSPFPAPAAQLSPPQRSLVQPAPTDTHQSMDTRGAIGSLTPLPGRELHALGEEMGEPLRRVRRRLYDKTPDPPDRRRCKPVNP